MDEQYKRLKEKYGLPEYALLDADFEISTIEQKSFLLRSVMKKILEKMELYTKLLEDLMHPESNLASMYECNIFSSEEKKEIFRLFKKLLYYHRLAIELDLQYEEKSCAKYLVDFFSDWTVIKRDLGKIVSQMKRSWTLELNDKLDSGYFG